MLVCGSRSGIGEPTGGEYIAGGRIVNLASARAGRATARVAPTADVIARHAISSSVRKAFGDTALVGKDTTAVVSTPLPITALVASAMAFAAPRVAASARIASGTKRCTGLRR